MFQLQSLLKCERELLKQCCILTCRNISQKLTISRVGLGANPGIKSTQSFAGMFSCICYIWQIFQIPQKNSPMLELWTDRCLDEFFAQGDQERKLGLTISPNCDRNETKKPESQIGFINFVVKPSYVVLAEVIPAVGEHILPVIERNLLYWDGQKGREETA
mmetsp:Transcript_20747/g.31465  ORF Transcript_20747/g.31465 Transcript_20747/m.31465 type:complete len:161 (+) Transcript_20747:44-526(+)